MNYSKTIRACFIGYIVQAIINNFLPLLFLTLQREYRIPLGQITALITVNFAVQLTVDLLSAFWADRIGYRRAVIAAHVFSAAGLLALPVLPELLPPFAGILAAVILYAVGGGLLEVLVSPIMEGCPTENKETAMRMLKSKLLEIKEREHLDKIEDIQGVKGNIEFGSAIRSYVFMPYTLVTDKRTGYETGDIAKVMDGNLDEFMNAYLIFKSGEKK